MSYKEANEMANFGSHILHPKTMLPLISSGIPLRIKSSKNPILPGTLINKKGSARGIKAVTSIEDVALVIIEGKGLSKKVGIDARIFSSLSEENISVRMIAQASSERGIGFVIDKSDAIKAELLLYKVFKLELQKEEISSIRINSEIAIIAILGRHNYSLEKAIRSLRKNRVWMHLISNSISGEHISLVVDNKDMSKAIRVVHNEVFGVIKTINLFALGKGNVGAALLDQIISTPKEIIEERKLNIRICGIADSKKYVCSTEGFGKNWREDLKNGNTYQNLSDLIAVVEESGLENVVFADNTSAKIIADQYIHLVKKNFDLVASNKKANSGNLTFYLKLREALQRKEKYFHYETNVGAGLPILDTLRNLRQSSDEVKKILGVFSGSLSYIFNAFSEEDLPFSEVIEDARKMAYTEPDPREDLSGMDVARKLVILAREVAYPGELEKVKVQNLIPPGLRGLSSYEDFIKERKTLDLYYAEKKKALAENKVLRYVGELDIERSLLKVELISVDKSCPLGQIKNADAIFEIYTKSYGEQPIIIRGAGAGAVVTARGVYSDLLRIGRKI